jgi:hypothetical protein
MRDALEVLAQISLALGIWLGLRSVGGGISSAGEGVGVGISRAGDSVGRGLTNFGRGHYDRWAR